MKSIFILYKIENNIYNINNYIINIIFINNE